MKEKQTSWSGVFFWIFLILGIILTGVASNKLKAGNIRGADETRMWFLFCFVISGGCFWYWLIAKVMKSSKETKAMKEDKEKQLKSQNAKIEQLQKQIEELKNKEEQ